MPNAVHEARGWVISEIAHDFRLLDVWALPAEGSANEFDPFLEVVTSFDPFESGTTASKALFRLRFRVGGWLRLDDHDKERPIPGCAVSGWRPGR